MLKAKKSVLTEYYVYSICSSCSKNSDLHLSAISMSVTLKFY